MAVKSKEKVQIKGRGIPEFNQMSNLIVNVTQTLFHLLFTLEGTCIIPMLQERC